MPDFVSHSFSYNFWSQPYILSIAILLTVVFYKLFGLSITFRKHRFQLSNFEIGKNDGNSSNALLLA